MLSDAIRTYHYVNIYIEIREQKKEKLKAYYDHQSSRSFIIKKMIVFVVFLFLRSFAYSQGN
jgi:hypothetical protein